MTRSAVTHVYLSPHHDDVCFSLGSLAAQQGGVLVNIFTQSVWVAAPLALPADRRARIAAISRLRAEEDALFAHDAGLARHDLGFAEPPVLGRPPFDLTMLAPEAEAVSARLIPYLLDLLPADDDARSAALYCPMGIGGHCNHLSILLSVRHAIAQLHQRCIVWLYEDLPYASDPQVRKAGVARVAGLFAGAQLTRSVLVLGPADVETKMQRIALYGSQHERPPHPRQFTPASDVAPGPHEIVWRVSPSPQ